MIKKYIDNYAKRLKELFLAKSNLLKILLLLIFSLRIAGIAFDIRIFSCVPDEHYYTKVIFKAFEKRSLDINFYWYPSFFFYFNLILFYITFYLSKIILIILKLWHPLSSAISLYLVYIIKLFVRVLNAFLGTFLAFVVYKISKRVFKETPALLYIVLVLIGFNLQFILSSHFAKPDILHTLLAQLTIYFALLYYDNDKEKYFYLSIIFSALAAGTKILGGSSVIVPMYFLIIKKLQNKNIPAFIKKSIIAFFIWIITFIISTPFVVLKFAKAKAVFNFYKNLSAMRHYRYLYFDRFKRFISIQMNIYTVVEITFLLISIIFLFRYIIKEKKVKIGAIYLFFIFYIIIGLLKNFFDARYYLPAVPEAFILMTLGGFLILKKIKNNYIFIGLVFILIIPTIIRGTKTTINLVKETTQEESYEYSNRGIPKKTYYAFEIMTGCMLRKNNKSIMFFGRRFPKFYKNSGITFLVHNTNLYKMFFKYESGKKALPKFYQTYQWIFNHSKIMKIFKKPKIDFLNPTIHYLKLVNTGIFKKNSILKINARFKNKTRYELWILSGNRLLYTIKPETSVELNKKFLVNSPKGRSIFIFLPLDKNTDPEELKGIVKYHISISFRKKGEKKIFTYSGKGILKPNEPLIFYLGAKK